jgi:hypothetical protein
VGVRLFDIYKVPWLRIADILIIIIIIKKMGESGFVAFILLIAVFCFSKTDLFQATCPYSRKIVFHS